MVVLRTFLRWTFLPTRRLRRMRILFSALTVATLWQLYFLNRGDYSMHDHTYAAYKERKEFNPAFGRFATQLQLGLRGRIFAVGATNLQREHDSMSRERAEKVAQHGSNRRNDPLSAHQDFQTTNPIEGTKSEGKSLSDLWSPKIATAEELRQHFCGDFYLTRTNKHSYGTCEPHKPAPDACRLAKQLYPYNPYLSECGQNKESGDICTFETKADKKGTVIKARCDEQVCQRIADKHSKFKRKSLTFGVYTVHPEDGVLTSLLNVSELSELETQLPRIALLTSRHKLNFLFVKCFEELQQTLASQLISVPPPITTTQETPKTRTKHTININIVLLDSVSRSHFYRSLPKTVEVLRKLTVNTNGASAAVFDFELFQAVHGHTTQNEHALFTGQLLPPSDPEENHPSVEAGVLFGHFKRAGYQTLWQDDLCWMAGWGLLSDLGAEDWEELKYKLNENFVDNTGLTHSSCEVLKSLSIDSPFNGPGGNQICYNGKLQHSYFLQYTVDMLKTIRTSRKVPPLFSFTTLNVGHDDTGLRIQSLDSDLAHYVDTMATDQDTLTIMLADHGNTYTEYTTAILEGRFEMFHPSLFMIVPNNVAWILGKEAMAALEVNQRRLVTMIDLHHTLLPLAGSISRFVKPVGLFTPISPNRTCNDIELRTPNLCVCEGWDSPTTNDSTKIAIVEFTVGELNNMILTQFLKATKSRKKAYPVLRACQRLRPLRFANVRERNSKSDGALITTLDIYFQAGDVVKHKEDIFHVEVKSKDMTIQNSLEMELVHFDRLTPFGKYDVCADRGIQIKLCICSENKLQKSFSVTLEKAPWVDYTTFLVKYAKARKVGDSECLFLIKRNHSAGQSIALEVANACPDENFTLQISAEFDNLRLSRKLPFVMDVPAGSITFAFSARIETDFWSTSLDVSVNVQSKTKQT